MSDETDYLDRLQRMGLALRHPPQFHESRIPRLLEVAHARAWFVACIPDHAPDEWQLFVDVWRMLPPEMGLPFLMLKSWLKRWHADVPWMERWMVNAAWAIRRGDDRGGALSLSELVSRQIGFSLRIIPLSIDLADFGVWREDLSEEWGPDPGKETEAAFLSRMQRAYERRHQQAHVPWPGAVFDRDAAWFVRHQIKGEDLSAMPDVESCRQNRRAMDAVLMEFALLVGIPPRGPLPRALNPW